MPYSIINPSEKPRLDRLRARAKRNGLRLEKSRQSYDCNHRGGLQLLERNRVIAGVDYELGLDEVAYWIDHAIQRAA